MPRNKAAPFFQPFIYCTLTDRQSSHSSQHDAGRKCAQCVPRGSCAQCAPRSNCVQCAPRTYHSVAPGYHRYERTQRESDYFCNCAQCRNLATSMDMCCQCCACVAAMPQTKPARQYNVRSVSLRGENQETLEVCITNDEVNDDPPEDLDDIARAHQAASDYHSCYPAQPASNHCANCPPPCRNLNHFQ